MEQEGESACAKFFGGGLEDVLQIAAEGGVRDDRDHDVA